jgi:ATP-binding cassette, subfamily B, multidrug efflux pump
MASKKSYHVQDDALFKAYDSTLMWRLMKFLRPHKALVALAILIVICGVCVELISPNLIGSATDIVNVKQVKEGKQNISEKTKTILPFIENRLKEIDSKATTLSEKIAGRKSLITIFGLIFFSSVVLRWALQYAEGFVLSLLGQKVILAIRMELYAHMQSLSLRFFDKNPVGRLVTRVTNDINAVSALFSEALISIIGNIFLIIGITAWMVLIDKRLALISMAIMPLLFVGMVFLRYFVRRAYRNVREKLAAINAFLAETFLGMKTVQLFCQEERKVKEFDHANKEYLDTVFHTNNLTSIMRPVATVISSIGIALILWYGGRLVLGHDPSVTLGTLVLFILLSQKFHHPIIEITQRYSTIQAAMASSERIFKILDTQPLIENHKNAIIPAGIRGHIEFRNVWFKYNEDGDWVLKDVSFIMKPGESVAIVGETGAGKSSIISLILRFYEIQKGRILIDGMDIREIDITALRRHFALVLQEVFVFAGEIAYNIRLGKDIPMEDVERCARYVNAHTFIEKMDGGYHADVKERGSALSVGQRQLLSFARALVANPSVLMLDEATSSVDMETELLIRDALQKLITNRTSIIVAHRLSTIKHVNKVIVIHKGEIKEQGTQQELLRKRGLFYRFYQLQAAEESTLKG